MIARLKSEGYCSIIYLDDLLLIASLREDCLINLNNTVSLLSSLGFLLNYSKSQLIPLRKCRYLRFIFDSRQQFIAIPPRRRRNLFKLMLCISEKRRCRIRKLAHMIGCLISVCPAVQYDLLHTKHFERTKFLVLSKSDDNYSATMDIFLYLKISDGESISFQIQNKQILSTLI